MLERVRRLIHRLGASGSHRSGDETRDYWRRPDSDNDPRKYLSNAECDRRSAYLVERVSAFLPEDASVFELGCNVGRNLNHLHRAGYSDLHAAEINEEALRLFGEHCPETAAVTTLHSGPAETVLPELADGSFELVFTMAVLEHIHSESEWIFEHMVRVTKSWLLTIEDEEGRSWRHFPRNYGEIFQSLGLRQVDHLQLNTAEHGLGPKFHARLFAR
jgi:SAM-dependent methyltransferase